MPLPLPRLLASLRRCPGAPWQPLSLRSRPFKRRLSCSVSATEDGANTEDAAAAERPLVGGPRQYARGPEAALLRAPLQQYLTAHTRQDALLRELRAETEAQHGQRASNLVAPEQAQLLAWLVESLGAARVLEVGAFTGYSALALAQALPPGGHLTVCEHNLEPLALGRGFWERAGVAEQVTVLEGAAEDTLQGILDMGRAETFDFAFLDATKRSYAALFELLLRLVRVGGVIVVDDVLWHGKVADPEDNTKVTAAVKAFNEALLDDTRISLSIVPVGDGMALCRRRS